MNDIYIFFFHGDYNIIFPGGMAKSTREVFISLLRSFWEAHACILEVTGATLTTLTVAVILPLSGDYKNKYAVCACNVGDSLGYIYSKLYGVREFTQGSTNNKCSLLGQHFIRLYFYHFQDLMT